jgi:hypothetical protein
MDVPKAPTELREEILEVTRVITDAPISPPIRHLCRRRLDQINLSLPSLVPSTPMQAILPGRVRKTRGLLDPLGVLVHYIFGLATTAEVENIKNVLKSVDRNQAAIVTKFELLTTVVNRSRIFAQENREYLNKLSTQVRNTQLALYNLTRKYSLMAIPVAMEQVLEDLEIQSSNLQRF